MYRRRARRPREIAFGLDSFLDVVANVVGIIIRLILVAWVGARAYQTLKTVPNAETPGHVLPTLPSPTDPLQYEIARQRQDLDAARLQALGEQQRLDTLRRENEQQGQHLAALSSQDRPFDAEWREIDLSLQDAAKTALTTGQTLTELRKRRLKLEEEIAALAKLPSAKKALYYRTPVSRPVVTEELHFECQDGRVAFLDLAAFVAEIKASARDKAETLKRQWQVEEATSAVGDFRLRYILERERGFLESVGGGPPDPDGNFRYGLSGWTVEALNPRRGETAMASLTTGSAFRGIVDVLDPEHTVVTLWVYPDSFELYRQLRDYLYERGIEVAGRPLPLGYPIRSSRYGSKSRGQ